VRFQNACNGEGAALPFCGSIDPCNGSRPERGGEWIKKVLREFKGTWTKVYERYRYQSGDHDAEDPVAEFMKFFGGDTIVLYAFIVFDHCDAMVGLLGKVCCEESQCDTGVEGENLNTGNSSTIIKKRRSSANHSEQRSNEKTIVLEIRDEGGKKNDNNSFSALQESEKDNIEFAKLILEKPLTTDEMKATALDMLKDMQAIKRSRLENLQNRAESFSTPF
jgi:hypothetical protein